ncbi:hypothetical protein BATDEDRAFT_25219 [Batrachochytrium dendrobatidis JAM81]|uniref:J domain-containing protein n=2 Tax=Batrachochytrium dendrobatidis TaxID=109871 RepID=F4P3X1_BATDJ|nr:uncharacterized protein BATDEDRAFT_25219 [Batrachochytrium dendrobatidis JAM81]EGF80293.1 hypothetical protein BATDEDRAFT_25219 [Batrachochytrium dendrobatidis JAM81]KAJ8326194.1 DnaJ sub C member 8 [Batrachochytrium dendrobatidis]KAK5671315.1 DnaJ subfamily C member 8 [Batrachochytrium dendrobatidis]OAJ40823.1 hypothetical protein BDEG_24520 [Batrachochytrium dendrobatidis JEL423]|eukprot:XP_006679060.1 hypothetical protein BATDEDRAFT_25219 [Batrachochytrium dendrobatidis JAM81]
MDDLDLDTFLRLESNDFNQRKEVERILALHAASTTIEPVDGEAFLSSVNPIELLDLPLTIYVTCDIQDRSIKLQYRKRSLLVHPDKCTHPRAQEAFDLLKKAEAAIMDPVKRKAILGFMFEARAIVFMAKKIPLPKVHTPVQTKQAEDAAPLPPVMPVSEPVDVRGILEQFPQIGTEIQTQTRKLLYELLNRDKIRMENAEGRRLAEAERELSERRRKMEHNKNWEATRDSRVDSWRKFQTGKTKKKKKKDDDLPPGAIPYNIAQHNPVQLLDSKQQSESSKQTSMQSHRAAPYRKR